LSKEKQKELKGMPQRTALGKKVVELLALRDDIEDSQGILEKVNKELVVLFKKEKKTSITIGRRTVIFSHLEQDKIKIKKETT